MGNVLSTTLGHVAMFVATALAGYSDVRINEIVYANADERGVRLAIEFGNHNQKERAPMNALNITFSFVDADHIRIKTEVTKYVTFIDASECSEPAGKIVELHITQENNQYKYHFVVEYDIDIINPLMLRASNSDVIKHIISYVFEEVKFQMECRNDIVEEK